MDLLDNEKIGNDFVPYTKQCLIGERYNSRKNDWNNDQYVIKFKLKNVWFGDIKNGLEDSYDNLHYAIKNPSREEVIKHITSKMIPNNPVSLLEETVKKYGQPDMYVPITQGKAIWRRKTLKKLKNTKHVHEILITDSFGIHMNPFPHMYFYSSKIYTTINTSLLKASVCSAELITGGGLKIDRILKTFTATSDSEYTNNVIIYIAILYTLTIISFHEAKYFYSKLMMDKGDQEDNVIIKLTELITFDIELPEDFKKHDLEILEFMENTEKKEITSWKDETIKRIDKRNFERKKKKLLEKLRLEDLKLLYKKGKFLTDKERFEIEKFEREEEKKRKERKK